MAWTLLRPTGFMQNTLAWGARVLDGTFYSPVPDAAFSVVDARDVAEVAAVALTEEGHEGKAYGLSGPEAVSYRDQARRVFAAAGREVEVEEIPVETLKRELVRAGVPPWNAEGLSELFEVYASGGAQMVTSGVKDVLDRDPRDIDAFAPTTWTRSRSSHDDGSAWGAGLATFSGERVLEVFYPDPRLGATTPGFSELSVEDAERTGCRRAAHRRSARHAPGARPDRDRGPPAAAGRHRRRLPAPAPALATGSSSRTSSTWTASSARCRTSPGRASARSTPRT